jgi:TRAP-type C4-dicarboxylate transport system substrate-binding protein
VLSLKKSSFAVLVMFVLGAMLCMVPAAFAAPVTLKFAGQYPADHPGTKLMESIAKEVAQKTQGRVNIKVYPGNQLGDYTLVYEELIRGTIDMSCTSVPSQFDPRLELMYINGYVTGYDSAKKAFDPKGWLFKKMDELNSRLGVKLLGFYVEGMIGTGTTKPAKDPLNPKVDKGILCRVPNMDVYKLGAEAQGYRTVTIPYADVYQSMQTGVCDGVNGFATTAALTALGDVLKYWYATNYSMECINYFVSKKTWDKLSPADQKILHEVVTKATMKSIDEAKALDEKSMKAMEAKGIKVFRYSEAQLAPIAKAVAASWPKLEGKMTKELITEFRKNLAPK